MVDFSYGLATELYGVIEAEREVAVREGRWRRELQEAKRSGGARRERRTPRLLRPFRNDEARMRRELFVHALESAQDEGITVDEWFAFRRLDPALSERARWSGLLEDRRGARAA